MSSKILRHSTLWPMATADFSVLALLSVMPLHFSACVSFVFISSIVLHFIRAHDVYNENKQVSLAGRLYHTPDTILFQSKFIDASFASVLVFSSFSRHVYNKLSRISDISCMRITNISTSNLVSHFRVQS